MPDSIVRTFQIRASLFSFFLLLPGALVAGCFSDGSYCLEAGESKGSVVRQRHDLKETMDASQSAKQVTLL